MKEVWENMLKSRSTYSLLQAFLKKRRRSLRRQAAFRREFIHQFHLLLLLGANGLKGSTHACYAFSDATAGSSLSPSSVAIGETPSANRVGGVAVVAAAAVAAKSDR